MKALVSRYPNDNDAAVLYAESLMDLNPWKFWAPDGTPADGTLEIVAVLERVLARDPDHPGANHYYIHAVEASPHPEKALASAEAAGNAGAFGGHLVHMPAHIYVRTGDYIDAARANVAAVRADERRSDYGSDTFYLIVYYGHNLHFLAIANAFAGNSRAAIAAANRLHEVELPRIKEVPGSTVFLFTPRAAARRIRTLGRDPRAARATVRGADDWGDVAFRAHGRAGGQGTRRRCTIRTRQIPRCRERTLQDDRITATTTPRASHRWRVRISTGGWR